MRTKLHQLDYIINVDIFQKIQDDIAKATDMAVITIDYKGHPITRHSNCSEFCSSIRQNHELNESCEKCDSRGGLEATRINKPYIYLCHYGIVDFAVPIVVDGQYLGALMAGQIRLENEENNQRLEHIVSKRDQLDHNDSQALRDSYEKLLVMPIDKIEAIAQMMHHLTNYIVGEAVLKTSLYEVKQLLVENQLNEHKPLSDLHHNIHLYYPRDGQDNMIETHNEIVVKNEKIMHEKEVLKAQKFSLLTPALNYISENYEKKIYQEDMASKCNISSSYFSKLFKRETGFNFSNYVNKTKVAAAQEILKTTFEPIINISLDLGFDDCGYFIKVFKKHLGVTPAAYRKQYEDYIEKNEELVTLSP
ncbi:MULTISPECIES: PocR ligand-binding domain-containing protein [unclassified Oceanispirochaeta]|uniref:PocR ligand-binding domain-containing protein n=1 Tax=unclassified Oceanispirochaeta TaxID=2635722 RepID=UPI000E08D2F8|nr:MULTISPECIES: PocR ligand-binding domain-containing protein [unclassified Oceanispirochaeta]MBF9017327.1 PocR ligand-binding domain-containing protein [Oceanispirochaeta sp. M2]NPD73837.1 helix-turn-helix domain-containing protein [Oceanispirochaeta sp. M1]RDG30437.1 helix-turn-helix domain-containing protein [Oceanispirochaeta sp. M1]